MRPAVPVRDRYIRRRAPLEDRESVVVEVVQLLILDLRVARCLVDPVRIAEALVCFHPEASQHHAGAVSCIGHAPHDRIRSRHRRLSDG